MATENFTGFDVISDVGATANSYVSVADTKVFWLTDPYKIIGTITDEEIAKAVITATKQIDLVYGKSFNGELYDETYSLFFPRLYLYDSRGVSITDYTIFPKEIAEATALQAWYVLQSNRVADNSVTGVKKQGMDGLGYQEYFSPNAQLSAKPSIIQDEVSLVLEPYVSSGTGKYSMTVGRG